METALNALWLLIALASFWQWRGRRLRLTARGQKQGPVLRGLLGLTCAFVLLFPWVSVSDDFQEEGSVREELYFSEPSFTDSVEHRETAAVGKHATDSAAIIPTGFCFHLSGSGTGFVPTEILPINLLLASPGIVRGPPAA